MFDNPDDLRARLHRDHVEIDQLMTELRATDDHDVAMRADLRNELVRALMVHTRAEEDVVYISLRTEPSLQTDVMHAERQHRDLLRALAEVEAADPSQPALLDALATLQDAVSHHVHEEENRVLPKAEARMGKEALADLIAPFEERKRELFRQRHSALETETTEPETTPTAPPGGLAEAPSLW
jgi:hemerythrin-like domain-containing protein